MAKSKLHSNVVRLKSQSATGADNSRAKNASRDFGRPKRAGDEVEIILSKQPTNLNHRDLKALYGEVNTLYKSAGRKWTVIGRIVSHIVASDPEASELARKESFTKHMDLSYGQAMQAKRVAEFYKRTPDEVEIYGFYGADLLRRYSRRVWRERMWKKFPSVEKLKAHFQEEKENTSTEKAPTILVHAQEGYEEISDGFEIQFNLGQVYLRMNYRDRDFSNLEKFIERETGKHPKFKS